MTTQKTARIASLLIAACAAVFAAGCAGHRKGAVASGGRPAWIEGESPEWPRASFITGVGSADDESSAADRARAEVSKVFSVDVAATSTVDESEANSSKNGQESHSYSNDVASKVRSATQKVLEGVDIVARWKDSSSARYYALAALPKDHALMAIMEKAQDIESEATQVKASFASATDTFGKAKAAAKLLVLAKAWTGLAADSRVLGGGPLPGDFDAAAARTQAAQALAALDVVVAVNGDGGSSIVTGIVSGLNAVGITAKSGLPDDKADITATAQVTVQPQTAGSDSRWIRSRTTATISLQDGRTGKVFSTFEVSAREDATDPGEARRRSLASLAKTAADKVTAAINDFFANQ